MILQQVGRWGSILPDCGAFLKAAEVEAQGGSAQAVTCNVLDSAQQAAALDQHLKAYGSLEAVCLNAGIFESGVAWLSCNHLIAQQLQGWANAEIKRMICQVHFLI